LGGQKSKNQKFQIMLCHGFTEESKVPWYGPSKNKTTFEEKNYSFWLPEKPL
jgi:hypothetical protein